MAFYNETHVCVGDNERISVRFDEYGSVHVKWSTSREGISHSSVNFSGNPEQLKNFFITAVREIVALSSPDEPVDRDELFDEE